MKRRVLSLLLAFVVLVSIFPTAGYATNEGSTAEVDTGDVSFEGTNGFGALLSAELAKNQMGSTQEQTENKTGYTVTGLKIDGNMANVEYYSMETAVLMVAIYSEDWMQLLASGQVVIDPEENQAVVAIEGEMPEYFQAAAYLMDTYDMSPLCVAYTTTLYTQAMQELLNSTIHDYDEDRVLNLDEDETTNFAVYDEDTIVIENRVGMNTVVSADDETATYVISNADASITNLRKGDVFVYQYGEEEMLIVKVASISVRGTTVTIIGDDTLEMEDVFQTVKIGGAGDTRDAIVDDSKADEGIVYIGKTSDGDASTYAVDGDISKKGSLKFEVTLEGENTSKVETSATATLELSLEVSLRYLFSKKTKYVEFTLTQTIEFDLTFEGTITGYEKALGELDIPIPAYPFIKIGFEPKLILEFSGEFSGKLEFNMTVGFCYDDAGMHKISNGPRFEPKCEAGFEVCLKIDFCPQISIEPLKCELAAIELNAVAGIKIGAAVVYESQDKNAPTHHECSQCLDMTLSFVAELGGTLELLNNKNYSVKIPFGEFEIDLGKAYYSLSHNEFGFGTCPYVAYRIALQLVDAEGKNVPNCEVTVSTLNKPVTTNRNGAAVFYTRPGFVAFTAEKDGYSAEISKNIQSAEKIVLILSNDFGAPIDYGNCGDNVYWAIYSDGLLRIFGDGSMYDFDGVDEPWRRYQEKISAIHIEKGVTRIGASAFDGYDNLTSITIPNSVVFIGRSAFYGSDGLRSVEIPDSVTTIGENAFSYCTSLTSINVNNGNPNYCSIDGVLFNKDATILIQYPNGITKSVYAIPDSVTSIGYRAFWYVRNLTSVEIPDSVTTIEEEAFYTCSNLTSVAIPDSVTNIGKAAFIWCDSVTNVSIGNGVTTIGDAAFYWCSSLENVEIGDSVVTIGSNAFAWCDFLTSITIPESVTTIGGFAFYYCWSLTDVYYAGTKEQWTKISIGDANDDLLDATIHYGTETPDEPDDLGELIDSGSCGANVYWALYDNGLLEISGSGQMRDMEAEEAPWYEYSDKINSVTIENGVTSIGGYAFSWCGSLAKVTIGDSVTTIGEYAFVSCQSLTNITIPDSVISIGDSAFHWCSGLTSIIIPDSVTSIGDRVFFSCLYLTSITLPDNLASIGDYVFYNCESLTSITIPESVISIGEYAFGACTSLSSIVLPNRVSDIGKSAFYSCQSLTSIIIPDGVTSISSDTFYNCSSLTSIAIPDSVTNIGSYTFVYCDSLTDVYYTGTKNQWEKISIGDHNDDLLNATIHYNTTKTASAVDAPIVRDESSVMNSTTPLAIYPGDQSTEDMGSYVLKTASFAGLVPGQQYILLALKSLDAENLLSADNLLYIYQAEAFEDGTLNFRYAQSKSVDVSYVMVCGASNKDLSDAQITFPEMIASDTLQTVDPTVVYDGETLTEGTDYVITGVVDYTEAGEYICYIRGINNYTGLVECHYTVQALLVKKGDVNGDGVVNGRDTIIIATAIANKTTQDLTPEQFKAADVNGDGVVNGRDTITIATAIANKTTDDL